MGNGSEFPPGESAKLTQLKLGHPDRTSLSDEMGEDIWDPTIETVDGERILYGGVMTPTDGKKNALWPDDHWNRRTYTFRNRSGRWIREMDPFWGEKPTEVSWIGDNCGHHFVKVSNGEVFVFYERVSQEFDGKPWQTEIFARKIIDAWKASAEEIPILKIPRRAWPSTKRSVGGTLVEGPRVFEDKGSFYISTK